MIGDRPLITLPDAQELKSGGSDSEGVFSDKILAFLFPAGTGGLDLTIENEIGDGGNIAVDVDPLTGKSLNEIDTVGFAELEHSKAAELEQFAVESLAKSIFLAS